jgi:hypothetical protein
MSSSLMRGIFSAVCIGPAYNETYTLMPSSALFLPGSLGAQFVLL